MRSHGRDLQMVVAEHEQALCMIVSTVRARAWCTETEKDIIQACNHRSTLARVLPPARLPRFLHRAPWRGNINLSVEPNRILHLEALKIILVQRI